jgi:glycosyltransferase involved in cell wall biosynthesis
MQFCFVFGLEPWLLPPALDMIAVLKQQGHGVKIIYAEYQGKKPDPNDYDLSLTYDLIPKITGVRRLLTFVALSRAVKRFLAENKTDIVVACDIVSLQSVVRIAGVKKGYWGFEIVNRPSKIKLSLDFCRALYFPLWIKKMNFYLAPSLSRAQKIQNRLKSNVASAVIYNCRKLVNNSAQIDKSFLKKDQYKLIYTGMISGSQYIEELVDAMELLGDHVTLTIAGPGNNDYCTKLRNKIAANPKLKDRVTMPGRLSREDTYDLINDGDIGIVFYNEKNGNEAADPAPNKLSDYIAGNLWVLGGGQEYIKYWLEGKGAGVSINEINKITIAAGINKLITDVRFNDKSILNTLYTNELNMHTQAVTFLKLIGS